MFFPAESELGQGETIDLASVWQCLADGRDRVIGKFFTQQRCGLLLARRPKVGLVQDACLLGRRRVVVESVLRGVSQNCLAIDLNLSPSTVALEARAGLEWLGSDGRPSRVHPMLMLAAGVAWRPAAPVPALEHACGRAESRLVSMPRPDLCLRASMPPAQREVVALLVEGLSHAEIAVQRRTARRTVANQLCASFRALQCSGRSELIYRLFELGGWVHASSARAA